MRMISVCLWAGAACLSLLITFGNVALVKFEQVAESSLYDADLSRDIYGSAPTSAATRWASACLADGLLTRKSLQLKQLDLIYGHATLSKSNQKLEETYDFLRSYLRCNPSDGSAWLAAAKVMNTINNDADLTMQYLALSKYFLPKDRNAIRNRQTILETVSPRLKSEYRDLFE